MYCETTMDNPCYLGLGSTGVILEDWRNGIRDRRYLLELEGW
jgi:hypothetical protein